MMLKKRKPSNFAPTIVIVWSTISLPSVCNLSLQSHKWKTPFIRGSCIFHSFNNHSLLRKVVYTKFKSTFDRKLTYNRIFIFNFINSTILEILNSMKIANGDRNDRSMIYFSHSHLIFLMLSLPSDNHEVLQCGNIWWRWGRWGRRGEREPLWIVIPGTSLNMNHLLCPCI